MTKKHAQRVHAKRRAQERYGITLNRREYYRLTKSLQKHISKNLIKKQSHRVAICSVVIDGQYINVVYDKSRHTIVTFLP